MRLTKSQKEEIIAAAISDKITPEWETAFERLKLVGIEAEQNRYSAETKKWISDAPPGALVTVGSVTLRVNESCLSYPGRTGLAQRRIHTPSSPRLYKDLDSSEITITGNLAKKAVRAIDALNKADAKRVELVTTLNAALAACNTHKQLHENYPCLAKYLHKSASASTALTITNSDVEKLLSRRKTA